MWGTLNDLSLHGCYIEVSNTFAVGTRVDLVLKSCDITIRSAGLVRASYPGLGMGICFAGIEPVQHLHLQELLSTLSRQSAAPAGPEHKNPPKDANPIKEVLLAAEPVAFLGEITNFFQKNQLLSRSEFYEIARRVWRA